ncbi:enoyl-CoA hydratase/isomerase family protein [Psychromicrobium sp. YIM B11713]|uniref:enoyl-CoA hydratase/isomerase family protein n=1 Tax=Psychromicrobium sp. YIM B11713 TaxID=3145233 RepID=UPI00374FC2A1
MSSDSSGTDPSGTPSFGTDQVLFERRGSLGVVTLNRPKAVNALTEPMVDGLLERLTAWAQDDDVAQVLIQGAGERGLCAGGDIVAIYRDITGQAEGDASAENPGEKTARFWRTEYKLNALIHNYPKPYIALMDGLVLGGGVGVSAHGSVRVVTERTRCGMPETTIGFVPDVGGTYLLSRSPGRTGVHAALTGAHLDGSDAIFLGLADYFVPAAKLPELTAALETEAAADVVPRFAQQPPASVLAEQQSWIDQAYAAATAEQIVAELRNGGADHPGYEYAAVIEAKSPTSVKVALESIRRAARLDSLEEVLDQEYRVGTRLAAAHDMREGIRAQVVDKDRNPQWQPATLAEVSERDVAGYFGE